MDGGGVGDDDADIAYGFDSDVGESEDNDGVDDGIERTDTKGDVAGEAVVVAVADDVDGVDDVDDGAASDGDGVGDVDGDGGDVGRSPISAKSSSSFFSDNDEYESLFSSLSFS